MIVSLVLALALSAQFSIIGAFSTNEGPSPIFDYPLYPSTGNNWNRAVYVMAKKSALKDGVSTDSLLALVSFFFATSICTTECQTETLSG